jgi:hypothetical protein
MSTDKSLPTFRKTAVSWIRKWLFASRQDVNFKKSWAFIEGLLIISTRAEFRRLSFDAIRGEFLTWVLLWLWFYTSGRFDLSIAVGLILYQWTFWLEYCCGFDFIPGDFCLEYCSDFDVTSRDFLSRILMWLWFDGWGLEVLSTPVLLNKTWFFLPRLLCSLCFLTLCIFSINWI